MLHTPYCPVAAILVVDCNQAACKMLVCLMAEPTTCALVVATSHRTGFLHLPADAKAAQKITEGILREVISPNPVTARHALALAVDFARKVGQYVMHLPDVAATCPPRMCSCSVT